MESLFPDYSGGTAPDLHRLPFYALAGTQDLARQVVPRRALNVNGIKINFTLKDGESEINVRDRL